MSTDPTPEREAEIAQLQARLADLGAEPAPPVRAGRSRAVLATVLLVVGALLLPFGMVGIWANRTIENTDRFVATVAPLIRDLQVQELLADRITELAVEQIDVEALATEVLPPRAAPLAKPIANGFESFVRSESLKLLQTPQLQQVWDTANANLQARVVAALKGDESQGVTVEGDAIVLDTGVILEELKAELVARGFTLLANVPIPDAADRSIVLVESESVSRISTIYRLSSVATAWLIWIALGLIALSVLVGVRRRRWALAAGVVIVGASVVVGLALAAGKESALVALGVGDTSVQAAVLDILTRFLSGLVRAGIALGLVLAIGAWLAGASAPARAIRGFVGQGEAAVARALVGASPGFVSVGEFFHRWLGAFRAAIAIIAVAFVFASTPLSAGRILWTAIFGLIAWLILDVLARTADQVPEPTSVAVASG